MILDYQLNLNGRELLEVILISVFALAVVEVFRRVLRQYRYGHMNVLYHKNLMNDFDGNFL